MSPTTNKTYTLTASNSKGTVSKNVIVNVTATPINPSETKIIANDGSVDDLFGESVAISGDTAIIGALSDDDHGL